MHGNLPTHEDISNEKEEVRRKRLAKPGPAVKIIQGDLYVRPEDVMMGGAMDDAIDVQEEFWALEKEGRTAELYLDGLFEWTFFKAKKEACYLLVLIVAVIE